MPKYTSRTGFDVVLKFNGVDVTIPANGVYETTAENLEQLFPKHVRKIIIKDVIQNIERRLLPSNLKEVPHATIEPIIEPIIHEAPVPKMKRWVVNPPVEVPPAPIKEVTLKNETHEKIVETINNIRATTNDPDLSEFLEMIRDILSSE